MPGRGSTFFYWDDVAGRRLRPEILTREAAFEQAKAWARGSGRGAVIPGFERPRYFSSD